MIDFRYHVVSLVAVLLALGVGIMMGSGLLGGPFLDHLDRQVRQLEERISQYQDDVSEKNAEIDQQEAFQRAVEPWLVQGALDGAKVVLFELDGTHGELIEALREQITERAGGEVATTVTFTEKFALRNDIDFDQLALALGSSATDPVTLRNEAATVVGSSAGDAASIPAGVRAGPTKLSALLNDLERAGFISIDSARPTPIPRRTGFVIAGGSDEPAAFDVSTFGHALALALAQERASVVVVEHSSSTWGLAESIRDDAETRDQVATIDHAETLSARMALVLVLRDAADGPARHYGIADGAEVFPEPVPTA